MVENITFVSHGTKIVGKVFVPMDVKQPAPAITITGKQNPSGQVQIQVPTDISMLIFDHSKQVLQEYLVDHFS